MTDYEKLEERREMMRSNYAAQMEMMGYDASGNPLDMVHVVRCKDCKHWVCADTVGSIRYGDCTNKHAMISRHAMPNENYYCADGERRNSE